MYHAEPVAASRREVLRQLVRAVAEPAGGDDHRAGGDLVVADRDTDDHVVRRDQAVDSLAQGDVDLGLAAVPGEDVDHGLTPADRDVDARHPLLTAEDQRVVELDAEVSEPLHGRPGELAEVADDAGVEVPAVELHVVVEQRTGIVLDAECLLVLRAGAHHQPAGQARRAADLALRLGDEHARAPAPRAVSAAANPATPEPTTTTSTSR